MILGGFTEHFSPKTLFNQSYKLLITSNTKYYSIRHINFELGILVFVRRDSFQLRFYVDISNFIDYVHFEYN